MKNLNNTKVSERLGMIIWGDIGKKIRCSLTVYRYQQLKCQNMQNRISEKCRINCAILQYLDNI